MVIEQGGKKFGSDPKGPQVTRKASGEIVMGRFCVETGTLAPYQAIEASTGVHVSMIALFDDRTAIANDTPSYSTTETAILEVLVPGQIYKVEFGGTVTRGDKLIPAANGRPITGTGPFVFAEAIDAGTVGSLGLVRITKSGSQGWGD